MKNKFGIFKKEQKIIDEDIKKYIFSNRKGFYNKKLK